MHLIYEPYTRFIRTRGQQRYGFGGERVTFFDLVCMWDFICLISIAHKNAKFDIAWKQQPLLSQFVICSRHWIFPVLFEFYLLHRSHFSWKKPLSFSLIAPKPYSQVSTEDVHFAFSQKRMRGDMNQMKPWITNKETLPVLCYVCLLHRVAWKIQSRVRQLNST